MSKAAHIAVMTGFRFDGTVARELLVLIRL